MIDSRGKIHRPIRVKSQQGALNGIGLSPGVVRGQARIMRSPHENPLLKGEVLIAYTTDPGWTPIFANASAIVLEIGGALQHGAVVARELGLPCVAGIEGVTTTIKNGQHIEVDGNSGTIRILQSAAN
jgi:pyruvate,water dikinase